MEEVTFAPLSGKFFRCNLCSGGKKLKKRELEGHRKMHQLNGKSYAPRETVYNTNLKKVFRNSKYFVMCPHCHETGRYPENGIKRCHYCKKEFEIFP
jgi:hypothetical protein